MATIDIRRSHRLTPDVTRLKAEELANGMKDRLGIRWQWDGDLIKFDAPSGKAKGATGTVTVIGQEVRVQIDLPFLLRPLKGMVESKVNEKLEGLLGPPA